jgi:hypothetical protein
MNDREMMFSILMRYVRAHPASKHPLMFVLVIAALLLTAVLAYFCWFVWLPQLWNWGFDPPTLKAVPALLGALYLCIIPVMPIVFGTGAIAAIMQASSGAPEQTAARAIRIQAGMIGKFRLGLLVFGVIPIIVALMAFAVYGAATSKLATLRWIFLIVVVLFPAMLYYLFNVSRRYSILTDLLSNLNRIGLLTRDSDLYREQTRQKRVITYLRKYESAYGDLSRRDLEKIREAAALDETPDPIEQNLEDDQRTLSAVLYETRIPVVIATVLIALGWAVALPPLDQAANWEDHFSPTVGPISFAFLGAYFFSIQMLLRRYIRRDLSSAAFASVSLRIILAVIGTWVIFHVVDLLLEKPLKQDAQLVLAFSVGLLPMIVIQGLAEVGKKIFAWAQVMESLRNNYPTSRLDGLSVWHAARLEEEDLDNVHGVATADILELMIQTRLPPDRIVEWIDQALLYSQLADAKQGTESLTDKLKRNGIRTATGLLVNEDQEGDKLKQLFSDQEQACLALASRAIRTKPNLEAVLRWRGIDVSRFPALDDVRQPPAP